LGKNGEERKEKERYVERDRESEGRNVAKLQIKNAIQVIANILKFD